MNAKAAICLTIGAAATTWIAALVVFRWLEFLIWRGEIVFRTCC